MLKRKIYHTLLNWKKTKRTECLLVKGARQIGKTFIIEKLWKATGKTSSIMLLYRCVRKLKIVTARFQDSWQKNIQNSNTK